VRCASTELTCAAVTEAQATWPLTLSGVSVDGTCVPGWFGNPTRVCQLTGVFDVIQNACQRMHTDTHTQTHPVSLSDLSCHT
jgi:hypothetical protein